MFIEIAFFVVTFSAGVAMIVSGIVGLRNRPAQPQEEEVEKPDALRALNHAVENGA